MSLLRNLDERVLQGHESFAGKRPAIARSCLKCCPGLDRIWNRFCLCLHNFSVYFSCVRSTFFFWSKLYNHWKVANPWVKSIRLGNNVQTSGCFGNLWRNSGLFSACKQLERYTTCWHSVEDCRIVLISGLWCIYQCILLHILLFLSWDVNTS